MDKNTGSSSETPKENIWCRRFRFKRECSRLTVVSHPEHGASKASRESLHFEKFVSREANITPALSRMAFTRSAGAVSDRVFVPRNDCVILLFSTNAESTNHSSVPFSPCSCVQMSWPRKRLPSCPENAKSEGYGSRIGHSKIARVMG